MQRLAFVTLFIFLAIGCSNEDGTGAYRAGTDKSSVVTAIAKGPGEGAALRQQAGECAVTKPNGSIPYGERPQPRANNTYFGQGQIWTSLWPDGVVTFRPNGPGEIRPDGSLAMKWPWWKSIPGELAIEGRRLDGSGELKADVPTSGYALIGIQPTALIFSGPGCWEVTASIDNASLTIITAVILTR